MFGCALLLAALPVAAKELMIPLSEAGAAGLRDKSVALTIHERPSFVAMSPGKAAFALLGAGAMIKAGNDLVDTNHVADPAIVVRENLSAALRDAYGAHLLPVDTKTTDAKKPKDLAALHREADYVLDVRSGGWMYSYYPAKWAAYWVAYSAQVQLIDAKTGTVLSNAACNSNTQANANPPSREQLHADGAKLLKEVTTSLGWMCVQLLAKEQLHIPAGTVAATPDEYVNPLAAVAPTGTDEVTTPTPPAAAPGTANDPVSGTD
jgi:hypothetical protein